MSFLFVKAMTNGGPDGASNVFLSYISQEAYILPTAMVWRSDLSYLSSRFALAGILNVTKREEIEF